MKAFVKAAKALGDPARVKILKILEVKPMCVCEVRSVLGLAQSTVSKHLKVLEEAGLVTWERDGAWVNYSLAPEDEGDAGRFLAVTARSLDSDPEITAARQLAARANRGQILCSPGEPATQQPTPAASPLNNGGGQ